MDSAKRLFRSEKEKLTKRRRNSFLFFYSFPAGVLWWSFVFCSMPARGRDFLQGQWRIIKLAIPSPQQFEIIPYISLFGRKKWSTAHARYCNNNVRTDSVWESKVGRNNRISLLPNKYNLRNLISMRCSFVPSDSRGSEFEE